MQRRSQPRRSRPHVAARRCQLFSFLLNLMRLFRFCWTWCMNWSIYVLPPSRNKWCYIVWNLSQVYCFSPLDGYLWPVRAPNQKQCGTEGVYMLLDAWTFCINLMNVVISRLHFVLDCVFFYKVNANCFLSDRNGWVDVSKSVAIVDFLSSDE
jgi:hypothetical protein